MSTLSQAEIDQRAKDRRDGSHSHAPKGPVKTAQEFVTRDAALTEAQVRQALGEAYVALQCSDVDFPEASRA